MTAGKEGGNRREESHRVMDRWPEVALVDLEGGEEEKVAESGFHRARLHRATSGAGKSRAAGKGTERRNDERSKFFQRS